MSNSEGHTNQLDPENLKEKSRRDCKKAIHRRAAALALEDGVINDEQAAKVIALRGIELIQSDAYPGDEYFDQATMELAREKF